MAETIVFAVFIRLWLFSPVPLLLQGICKDVSCNMLGQSLPLAVPYNVLQSCSLSQIYVYVAEPFQVSVATKLQVLGSLELVQAFFANQNWVGLFCSERSLFSLGQQELF